MPRSRCGSASSFVTSASNRGKRRTTMRAFAAIVSGVLIAAACGGGTGGAGAAAGTLNPTDGKLRLPGINRQSAVYSQLSCKKTDEEVQRGAGKFKERKSMTR